MSLSEIVLFTRSLPSPREGGAPEGEGAKGFPLKYAVLDLTMFLQTGEGLDSYPIIGWDVDEEFHRLFTALPRIAPSKKAEDSTGIAERVLTSAELLRVLPLDDRYQSLLLQLMNKYNDYGPYVQHCNGNCEEAWAAYAVEFWNMPVPAFALEICNPFPMVYGRVDDLTAWLDAREVRLKRLWGLVRKQVLPFLSESFFGPMMAAGERLRKIDMEEFEAEPMAAKQARLA